MIEKKVKIIDKLGIHARPATIMVSAASKFDSNCLLKYNDKSGNLKSMMGVMALGIKFDEEVTIIIDGNDEEAALLSITSVMEKEGLI